MPRVLPLLIAASLVALAAAPPQHQPHHHDPAAVPLQPLAQQVRRLVSALDYLGRPLPVSDLAAIDEAIASPDEAEAVARLQAVLDQHVLAVVHINPESRVKVAQGAAPPELAQGGTRAFLVKVLNEAGVTAPLAVSSPNSGRVYKPSAFSMDPDPPMELTMEDVRQRWADISIHTRPPLRERLSGLGVEYAVLEIYSRDAGPRSAVISFDVGQGTQDIGFRNDVEILFHAVPAHPVTLHVRDEHGEPTTASFLIRDRLGRVYPHRSKRLAPDFFFQPQIYRSDGDVIHLPEGTYSIESTRGPEYLAETRELTVGGPGEVSFALDRWIDPSARGWYSGDHHVHSAGCSHYINPTQGVTPEDIWPQVRGEALNVACVLIWGPCYYHQKQYFTGEDHPLSTPDTILRYDLEISGFPSSHAGHLVLLNLTEQDYPGTGRLEDWPTWTLPILRWAKAQGAVTGYAHSGWGLQVKTDALPNYEVPGFDGIGANEFIVAVTEPGLVDFIAAGDTPSVWELNVWYHTLNVGFRTMISGETDFPCITDDRVGQARSYAKVEGPLTYDAWTAAVREGLTYVSDGTSHLMDFAVDGVASGGEVRLKGARMVRVTADVAALLDEVPNPAIRDRRYDEQPYWHLERARLGTSREVPVELVVNGEAVARQTIVADGVVRPVTFDVPVSQSSWVALRILPSSHTNPVFVLVGDRPIRASRRSAEWALAGVNQCWTQKAPQIAPGERTEARAAYDRAREVYRRLIEEHESHHEGTYHDGTKDHEDTHHEDTKDHEGTKKD